VNVSSYKLVRISLPSAFSVVLDVSFINRHSGALVKNVVGPGNVDIIDHPYEVQSFHGILLDLFFCNHLLLALDDESNFFLSMRTEDIIRTYILCRRVRHFVACI